MNLFRFIADMSHLASKLILLFNMHKTNSVIGLSLKTQIVYLVVFIARYTDLFYRFISAYNSFMKLTYIGTSVYTCYLIFKPLNSSYDPEEDTVSIYPILGLPIIASLIFNLNDILWSYSIYLEAVAILPQLWMSYQHRHTQDTITNYFLYCLGSYRFFYILNWIYKASTGTGNVEPTAVFAGVVQTLIYGVFFIVFFRRPAYVQLDENLESGLGSRPPPPASELFTPDLDDEFDDDATIQTLSAPDQKVNQQQPSPASPTATSPEKAAGTS